MASVPDDVTASRHWQVQLEAWAIPDQIRAQAVSFPYEMDPALFRPSEGSAAPSLATRRALEAISDGPPGTVIDVGCGGGAATMALADHLAAAVGVDQSESMLAVFGEEARARGIECTTVPGTWPEVADQAGTADVVVCHHVAYNVADLVPFVLALDAAAGRRVVMELTLTHPQTSNSPLWQQFWGLDRPEGPTAEDAHAVVEEAGIAARLEFGPAGALRRIAELRDRAITATRMLCLGPERVDEVEAAVRALPPRSEQRAVIWWDTAPGV